MKDDMEDCDSVKERMAGLRDLKDDMDQPPSDLRMADQRDLKDDMGHDTLK